MDLRLKNPEPEIKPQTIINEVIVDTEEIVNDTRSCFTKISMLLKKMIYCQCESSSNCIKKHEPENKK
jgi:hypothetical protein